MAGPYELWKSFHFVLDLQGPFVKSKNLFGSTFLFLYGNTNICLRNKIRSYYEKQKAHKNGKNTEKYPCFLTVKKEVFSIKPLRFLRTIVM